MGLRLKSLQGAPQPLVDLFNQYAVPYHQWELCIELVHASDGVDMAYVQQLWDLYLKQVSWWSAMLAVPIAVDMASCLEQGPVCPTKHIGFVS